jgi:hypothetical protein
MPAVRTSFVFRIPISTDQGKNDMKRGLFVALLAVFMTVPSMFAQEAATAVLTGVITDPGGASVPTANIVIENVDTGLKRNVVSSDQGIYRAQLLPIGNYAVTVEASGFAITKQTGIHLGVGQEVSLNVALKLSTVAASVEVTAEAAPVETTRYDRTQVIGSESIEFLPINGRDFTDFSSLAPTVLSVASSSGKSISVGGGSAMTTGISLDGMDYSAPFRGMQTGAVSPYILSEDAVQEFEVVQGGFAPEFGRSMGGRINVVTKSGGNLFHGSGFYYYRGSDLATNDALNRALNFTSQQFGGSVGGPIIKDKLFFFAVYDQQQQTIPLFLSIPTSLIQAGDQLDPQLNLAAQIGRFQSTNNGENVFAKIDYNLTSTQMLSGRFNYVNGQQANINTSPNAALGTERNQQGYVFNEMGSYITIMGKKLNEFRVEVSRDNQPIESNPLGAGLPSANVIVNGTSYNIGGPGSEQNPFYQNRVEVTDSFGYQAGSHSIKFGGDFNRTGLDQYYASAPHGSYTYTSLANFLAGDASSFNQYVPLNGLSVVQAATTKFDNHLLAFYVQDTWRARKNLTVNYGFRWEGQWNPQAKVNPNYPLTGHIPNELKNPAPRLGITWDPLGKGKTVIRVGAGYFYSYTNGQDLIRAFDTNATTGAGITLTPAGAGGNLIPTFPNAFASFSSLPAASIPALNITYFDPHFEAPRTIQWTGGVEHEIASGTTVSVDLIMSNTVHGDYMRNINLFPSTATDANGRPLYNNLVRPDMQFNQIRVIESASRATYNALIFSIKKRMNRWYQLQANYTYAHARDNAGTAFDDVWTVNTQDNYNFGHDMGYSATDVRHRAVLSNVFKLPYGIVMSQIVTYQTGLPYNGVLSTDANGDGNFNDRLYSNGVVQPLNFYRQPVFFNWNVRLMKQIRIHSDRNLLEPSAEFFNITNASNFTTTNTTVNISSFGKLNVPGTPFEAQFSVRYRF